MEAVPHDEPAQPLLLSAAQGVEALARRQQAGAVQRGLAGGQLQGLLAVEARAPQQVQRLLVGLRSAQQPRGRLGAQQGRQALSHGPTSRHRGGSSP